MSRLMEMGRSYVVKATMAGTLALGVAAISPASAVAQDRLNFEGAVDLRDAPVATNLFIDFLTNGETGGPGVGTIIATETISGEFASTISANDEGAIRDLTISPSGVVGAPVSPFVTIGGFTFSLDNADDGNTFGPISLFATGSSTIAAFSIDGTVMGGGFGSNRTFVGAFSAQIAGMTPEEVQATLERGDAIEAVSFSAEFIVNDVQVVPEPSTYLLLATGLGALGLVGLRRRATQA